MDRFILGVAWQGIDADFSPRSGELQCVSGLVESHRFARTRAFGVIVAWILYDYGERTMMRLVTMDGGVRSSDRERDRERVRVGPDRSGDEQG